MAWLPPSVRCPSEFTYAPVREIYQLKLTMAHKPGRYKLLINSLLFAEPCASSAVTE